MTKKPLMALCAVFVASAALALVGPRAHGENDPAPSATGQTETPVTVSWSKGSDDGSAVFHLTIYAPWGDATQRTIAFYSGYVTNAGLAGLEGTRISEVAASAEPLEAVGERFKCTARLNQVGSWAQVRAKRDVTLTITPIEQ